MNKQSDFDSLPIGFEFGTIEVELDKAMVQDYADQMQWNAKELLTRHGFAPPGITVINHSKMKFKARPELKVAIWAKTEHEFIKPMEIGSKVFISGKVIDKYVKRGRNFVVAEYETVDENGDLLMKSRETGLHVE